MLFQPQDLKQLSSRKMLTDLTLRWRSSEKADVDATVDALAFLVAEKVQLRAVDVPDYLHAPICTRLPHLTVYKEDSLKQFKPRKKD